MWSTLEKFQKPELRALAEALKSTILSSRAASTTSKYVNAFLRWKRWAQQYEGFEVVPAKEAEFALYLQFVSASTASKAAVEEAVNGVSWVQQLAGFPPLSDSPFISIVLDGLQRRLAKPTIRKEPVSNEMIVALVNSLGKSPTLSDVRLVAACMLAFSAFLRYDELARLRCSDVAFHDTHMEVHITSSKTDQYRQGNKVIVARTGSHTCPVAMLERYYAMGLITKDAKLRLFRGITSTRVGERLRSHGSLSYTRLRELFLQKLTSLGFDAKQFGLHSLRAGGATAAAQAGVPDRLFKRHGRWRSESAKDGYVKDSMSSLMSVSQSLQL